MTFASQFLSSNLPVGATDSGYNLPSANWLLADGRALLRADYPLLSPKFPIGKMAGAARTLASVPVQPLIKPTLHASGFIALGASGTSCVQASTNNGASWATVSTPSVTPSAIFVSSFGIVFVLNSAAAQGTVSGGADTHTFSFSAMSGGPTSVATGTSMSRLVEVEQAVSGNRYVIAIPSASGNTLFSTLAVSPSGTFTTVIIGETSVKQAGCWTGSRLLILKAGSSAMLNIQFQPSVGGGGGLVVDSTTTITLPEAIAAGQGNIASDGNGKVVISGIASGLMFSKDNGDTFVTCNLPGVVLSNTWRVQFSDGYWMVETAQGTLYSNDAENWQLDVQPLQTFNVASGLAKKGNKLVQIVNTVNAFSLDQSTTEFNLPIVKKYSWVVGGTYQPMAPTYIKVK